MAIRYEPSKLLKKLAPRSAARRLVTKNLTLNRAALSTLTDMGVVSKERMTEVALKVIKGYRERFAKAKEQGLSKAEAFAQATNEGKQIAQRVRNATVFEVAKDIKRKYRGEYYEWLETTANVPDEIHRLNWGKIFRIGVGEMPGERYGCQCGMRILTDDEELDL